MLTEVRIPRRPTAVAPTRRSSAAPATSRSPPSSAAVWIDGRHDRATPGSRSARSAPITIQATRAVELLRGKTPSEELFAQAGEIAAEDCCPQPDGRGPVDYKRHLAGVLTKRALRRATARALHTGGLNQCT